MDDDGNPVYCSEEIVDQVLDDLDGTDYILEKAFDCITDYITDYTK